MEVEIVSSENIKPSSPTPPHLRNMTLCFLDQMFTPILVPVLLFFNNLSKDSAPLDITRLKTCLSETLSHFYPLAGRYTTWGTIICKDEGIPFVEAKVNCPLSHVLNSKSNMEAINLLSFYPPGDDLIASGIHLAIQVNVFTCNGFAIGWYDTHKVTDGISAATFLRHWAALVTQRYKDAAQAQPDFSASVKAFPPIHMEVKQPAATLLTTETKRIITRSFVFNKQAIVELKAKSMSDRLQNPSRFLSVAGFLLKQILLASPKEGKSSMFGVALDLRSRSDPPMPKTSIGNLVDVALTRVETDVQLQEMVVEIRESISKMKDVVLEYQGENGLEAKRKYWQNIIKTIFECNKSKEIYATLTSWCGSSGFGNIDFGFGKPTWIVPTDGILKSVVRNTIILTEYTDSEGGDGFEAWLLFKEEEPIRFLETNPQFLAFASPNFKAQQC